MQPDAAPLTAEQITRKQNGRPREVVPLGCNHLSLFLDVPQNLLYGFVAAWEEDFTGYVLDYFLAVPVDQNDV